MAINAYTGLMGSGKSYEVVENVILPALLAGRRVVTNVANLQQDEIFAYLVEKFGGDLAKLGQIVQFQNADLSKSDFFPVEDATGHVMGESLVMPGDLVVVDECWRWWAQGEKIPASHMVFFRMHRHFVNVQTGSSCDLVLVAQDISDLDRKLKVVVENTYRMTKHKALGSSTRYRVDVYISYKTTKAPYLSFQRKYKKEIFALYQSYSQGGGKTGKEVAIDDRANIFRGAVIKLALPLVLLVLGLCIWFLWRFFHRPAAPVTPEAGSAPVVASEAHAVPVLPQPAESDWRIVGDYKFGIHHYVLIQRAGRVRTLINPHGFYFDGVRATGALDGALLTNYTGQEERSNLLLEDKK